mgnify:CR=1 FL=1
MIKLKNISVSVDQKPILENISFNLKPSQITALMGPNGSGKSSIAYTLAGHPSYQITSGKIIFNKKDITNLSPDKRSDLGIFLANQAPIAIPGLNVKNFLWQLYKKHNSKNSITISEFRSLLDQEATNLDIKKELLDRHLNDGFSGGERKKMEILQMVISKPQFIILDEIDSGLDVDALKIISSRIKKLSVESNLSILIITHFAKILDYLKPDQVVILEKGKIKKIGDTKLVNQVETIGFNH